MVALQIRDVSEEVRDALARAAQLNGQSLQGYLLGLVTEEAKRQRNVEILNRFEGRSDGVGDDDPDAVRDTLDAARAERDAQLMSGWEEKEKVLDRGRRQRAGQLVDQ